jgi:hypothetical protein
MDRKEILREALLLTKEPAFCGVILRIMQGHAESKVKALVSSNEGGDRHRGFIEAVRLLERIGDEIRKELST